MTLCAILFPIIAGTAVSAISMENAKRHRLYVAVLIITDILAIAAAALSGPMTLMTFSEQVTLYLCYDGVGGIFLAGVLILYTAVLPYAFEYMSTEERENVFFAFYFISFGAMIAVTAAGNMVSVYLFFELATLSSMPLVLHELTEPAVAAALKYLFYSVAGALMGLLGVFFVYFYGSGGRSFVAGGFLDPAKTAGHEGLLLAVFFIAIMGFGAKAGMYPLHGWLPAAHPIAPAPASSLLSAMIAKAGIMAVTRLVFFSVGVDFLKGTWVQKAWMSIACLTIFMGSMMAFREKVTKKRLAYSSISQISYIMLALSVMSQDGMTGAFLQYFQHMASKGCLFLCAGAFIHLLGKTRVDQLKGVGKQVPVTLACFTVASLSLVGIPPMGGFASKWFIAVSAINDGLGILSVLPPVILLISALLTAGYLFTIVVDGFFPGHAEEEHGGSAKPAKASGKGHGKQKNEPAPAAETLTRVHEPALMIWPMIALCVVAALVGIFSGQLADMFAAAMTGLF